MIRLYSDLPAGRARQVVSDVAMVVWTVFWIRVGMRLYDAVLALGAPGREIARAGGGLERSLRAAGEKVSGVPLVGDDVRTPFDRAGAAGAALRGAGEAQVEAVHALALFLGVAIAALPIAVFLLVWLPRRIRFVRRAHAAATLVDSGADLDLFALRALTRRPLPTLVRIHDDPAGAWRAGDQEVIRALAALELSASGIRLPERATPTMPVETTD
ncbi:MAG: hypothetical protein WBF79_07400 [Rhodococcus sp. (in: high G+C Gram-positive bacteria)]